MYFYYSKNGLKLKNTFELKNVSNVPAIFQFYTNEEQEDQEIFKLDVVRGCLQPSRHMYITVSFATRTIGIFSRNMYCLIKNHVRDTSISIIKLVIMFSEISIL